MIGSWPWIWCTNEHEMTSGLQNCKTTFKICGSLWSAIPDHSKIIIIYCVARTFLWKNFFAALLGKTGKGKAEIKSLAFGCNSAFKCIWKSSFPCICNCWCPFRVSGMQMIHQGFYDSLQGDMVQSTFTCQMYRYAPSNTDVENSAPHKLWSLPMLRPSANQHLLKAPLKQESSPVWDFHTCEAL